MVSNYKPEYKEDIRRIITVFQDDAEAHSKEVQDLQLTSFVRMIGGRRPHCAKAGLPALDQGIYRRGFGRNVGRLPTPRNALASACARMHIPIAHTAETFKVRLMQPPVALLSPHFLAFSIVPTFS